MFELLFNHKMIDAQEPKFRPTLRPSEPQIPENVFINLEPRFASLVFTVPYLQVNLPENPTLLPKKDRMVVRLKNNGRLQVNPYDTQQLDGKDRSQQTDIETIEWEGRIISGQELLTQRRQLLEEFFEKMLGGKTQVADLRKVNEQSDLTKGSYLYRAIGNSEQWRLEKERYKEVSFLDPSANFENEEMYNNQNSQVKHYSAKKGDEYSGQIIRWKIEHPLLYRRAGLNPPRIQPMFSHYLPQVIEISQDRGKTFVPIQHSKK